MDDVLDDTFSKHLEWYNRDFNENLKHEDIVSGEVHENVPLERQHSIKQLVEARF